MNNKDYWKHRLTAFDAALCNMVESLTGEKCEPKNGGNDQYFIVVDYRKHPDTDFISAVMDAIAGRVGERLIAIHDHADDKFFTAFIKFYTEPCKDAAFIPKPEKQWK